MYCCLLLQIYLCCLWLRLCSRDTYGFERSLSCSPRLHLFDKIAVKIVKYYSNLKQRFSFIGELNAALTASGTPTAWPSLNPYRISPIHWLMARRHLWHNDVVSSYWWTRHPLLRFLCLHEAVTLPFVVAISGPNLSCDHPSALRRLPQWNFVLLAVKCHGVSPLSTAVRAFHRSRRPTQ